MKTYGVIMAGGGGTRFWPVSRMTTPKQLAKLTGDDVMINETIKHYDGVIPRENTFIVTNEKQAILTDKVLFDEVDRSHILVEPVQRNTAPCIIYAAMTLKKMYGDALMAVLPADHHIGNIKEYERILNLALDTAEKTDRIVTIGIKPTFPDISVVSALAETGLPNGIINAVVDYTLQKKNNILDRFFAEKILSGIAREGITNTLDAMNYMKKLSSKKTVMLKTRFPKNTKSISTL